MRTRILLILAITLATLPQPYREALAQTIPTASTKTLVNTNNLSDLSSASTARTNLGVAIGTNVQAHSAQLDSAAASSNVAAVIANSGSADISGLSSLKLPQTGVNAFDGQIYVWPSFGMISGVQSTQLYISASANCRKVYNINGGASVYSDPSSTVRDATGFQDPVSHKFYVAYTSGSFGNSGYIGLASSSDLVNWTVVYSSGTTPAMTASGFANGSSRMWSNNFFMDTSAGAAGWANLHYLFSGSTAHTGISPGDTIYEMHPTDGTFLHWSSPAALSGLPTSTDGNHASTPEWNEAEVFFSQDDNLYHMVLTNLNAAGGGRVEHFTAPAGSYSGAMSGWTWTYQGAISIPAGNAEGIFILPTGPVFVSTTSGTAVASTGSATITPAAMSGTDLHGVTWKITPGMTLVYDAGGANQENVTVTGTTGTTFTATFAHTHSTSCAITAVKHRWRLFCDNASGTPSYGYYYYELDPQYSLVNTAGVPVDSQLVQRNGKPFLVSQSYFSDWRPAGADDFGTMAEQNAESPTLGTATITTANVTTETVNGLIVNGASPSVSVYDQVNSGQYYSLFSNTNILHLSIDGGDVALLDASGGTLKFKPSTDHTGQLGDSSHRWASAIAGHYLGGTATPTVAAGTGAGTSPTVTVTGTDSGFTLSVTTGTSTAANAVIATVTFSSAYGVAPHFSLTGSNGSAASLAGASAVIPTSTASTFVLTANTSALVASTVYTWEVVVTGGGS